MRGARVILALLAAAFTATSHAAMYTQHEIAADRGRIAGRVAELQRLITQPAYLKPEQRRLSQVPVLTPDIAPNGDPMGFLAHDGRVYLPIAGLKFIEDLTMAYAWRYRRGLSLEPIDEYLAMLRWKPERD
jgi:hypothetical protein